MYENAIDNKNKGVWKHQHLQDIKFQFNKQNNSWKLKKVPLLILTVDLMCKWAHVVKFPVLNNINTENIYKKNQISNYLI